MTLRYRQAAWLLFLFLLAWLPRTLALDAYVSPDERKWLARSANFAYALSHADFAQTFQREHPGVTVMWAGARPARRFSRVSTAGAGVLHVGARTLRGMAQGKQRSHAAGAIGGRPPLDRLRRGAALMAGHLSHATVARKRRRLSDLHFSRR
jgi:hypothetical protein